MAFLSTVFSSLLGNLFSFLQATELNAIFFFQYLVLRGKYQSLTTESEAS